MGSFFIEHASLWQNISAVAYALMDAKGCVIEANKGFDLLLPPALHGKAGSDVSAYFINPEFRQLVAADNPNRESRIFTLGMVETKTYSVSGWFLPYKKDFLFLAEHNVGGLAKVSDALPDTDKELSRLQRDLLSANRRLKVREQQIRELSLTDSLTGLANRRRLNEGIEAAISSATRHKRPLSAVMADIDHFKSINDDFGHDAGDRVLRAIADLLKQHCRMSDLVARFGGEEFFILMPECDVRRAKASAGRIRSEVALIKVPHVNRPVTASFGVVQFVDGDTANSLLVRADAAMYQAKAKGRNRVEAKAP